MLFQVLIQGYTVVDGVNYIRTSAPCSFNGRHKVSLVNFAYHYDGAVNPLPIQLLSQSLTNSISGSAISLFTNPSYMAVYNLNKFNFDCVLNGYIDIDLRLFTLSAGGAGNPPVGNFNVPTNFGYALFTFDITRI